MTRIEVGADGAIRSIPSHGSQRFPLRIIPCADPCVEDDSFLVDCPPVYWEQGQDYQLSGSGTAETPELTAKSRPRPVKRKRREDDLGKGAKTFPID